MHDNYLSFAQSSFGKKICGLIGLPQPARLKRSTNSPENTVPRILIASNRDSFEQSKNAQLLKKALVGSAIEFHQKSSALIPENENENKHFDGCVFDATKVSQSDELKGLHEFFSSVVKQINTSGKITIIGIALNVSENAAMAIAQRSLIGFAKSLAKELGRKGITVNLLQAHTFDLSAIDGPLRFLQSYRSAYVNGQTIECKNTLSAQTEPLDEPLNSKALEWKKPLSNKIALVTGASRGIGAEIAQILARDGAKVIGLDIPQVSSQLDKTMKAIGGHSICLDISHEASPETLADFIEGLEGHIDIVVHNAGVTRDKMLTRMPLDKWQQVIGINLTAVESINEMLLERNLISNHGRIIGVSSISGIAGNVGQTNYATSKAGIIGLVNAYSKLLVDRNITVNAVAPGFIETEMTASIPFMTRHLGRRLCSLSQGGLPIDVAETISFIASPAAGAVTGNTIRVCGQNLLGA